MAVAGFRCFNSGSIVSISRLSLEYIPVWDEPYSRVIVNLKDEFTRFIS
jgi:hypothetical protein